MAAASTTTTISLPSTLSSSNPFTGNKLINPHKLNQSSPSNFITLRQKSLPLTSKIRASLKTTNKAKSTSEQKWTHEGVITESLPNGMFMVRLENEDVVLGYISGRIRRSSIRILPGDRVKIEVSRYDSNRGRIVYRLRGKDLTENPT